MLSGTKIKLGSVDPTKSIIPSQRLTFLLNHPEMPWYYTKQTASVMQEIII